MNLTGIHSGGPAYFLPSHLPGETKKEDGKTEQASRLDTVSISGQAGAAYYTSLRQKFDCVRNGNVSISGIYLEQCAKNPEKAAELEENLAVYHDLAQRGYQNAAMSVQAAGGKLLSYTETWNIDSEGHITMISCGTAEYASGPESWREETLLEDPKKLWAEGKEKRTTAPAPSENEEEEVSEQQGGKVAVNVGKRARQIAAAQSRDQLQQVLALLQEDMADCKAGLEKGWCDEAEIAKVEALISQAKARMGQVPEKAGEPLGGLDAFELASLM